MEFTKLSSPSLRELFVQQLEHMILSGKLQIGEKLPSERQLSVAMQVSRAVVNSGISDLERMGFLIIKPRIGTFVADYRRNGTLETLSAIMNYNGGRLRDEEIHSILEVRAALCSLAVELSINKITNEEINILYDKTAKIKNTVSVSEASEAAFEFYHEFAIISGNTLLPLIFYSFKVAVVNLWERFCTIYGVEPLYENTHMLLQYLSAHDKDMAIKFIHASMEDSISGKHPIYY